MTKRPPKVVAHMERAVTTIDNDTGDARVTRKGVLKGFGKGFQDYLQGSIVQVDIALEVGQFPDGHVDAGKWAVRVQFWPLDTEEQANALADKVAPIVRNALGNGVSLPPFMKRQ